MTTNEMYQQLGISPEVLDFGQRVLDGLDEEMSRVDDIAEYNQAKVLCRHAQESAQCHPL